MSCEVLEAFYTEVINKELDEHPEYLDEESNGGKLLIKNKLRAMKHPDGTKFTPSILIKVMRELFPVWWQSAFPQAIGEPKAKGVNPISEPKANGVNPKRSEEPPKRSEVSPKQEAKREEPPKDGYSHIAPEDEVRDRLVAFYMEMVRKELREHPEYRDPTRRSQAKIAIKDKLKAMPHPDGTKFTPSECVKAVQRALDHNPQQPRSPIEMVLKEDGSASVEFYTAAINKILEEHPEYLERGQHGKIATALIEEMKISYPQKRLAQDDEKEELLNALLGITNKLLGKY
jgi:hypothetical protein